MREYALRDIFSRDKDIIEKNKVKTVVTTNSAKNVAYDSINFDRNGGITRHVLLHSDLRNDFDSEVAFKNEHYDIIFNLVFDSSNKKTIYSQNEVWEFTNFIKTDSSYRIIFTEDTLKYYFNSPFGNVGNFYKTEHYLPGYKQLHLLTQTLQFENKKKWYDIDTKLIYQYNSDNKIQRLTSMYDGKDEFWTIDASYDNNSVTFTSSDFNPRISKGLPDFVTQKYIFNNGRILRKEIAYPKRINVEPISIITEYTYKPNGLIDYTTTNYSEYPESEKHDEASIVNGTFIKYYKYEYYN